MKVTITKETRWERGVPAGVFPAETLGRVIGGFNDGKLVVKNKYVDNKILFLDGTNCYDLSENLNLRIEALPVGTTVEIVQ